MTEDLKTALPDRLTELVALTVSTWMENAYERVQHERLSLRLGFSERWIRDVVKLDPGASAQLDVDERAVQRLVLAILERRGHDCTAELETAVAAIDHTRAMAVLMLIGRYVMHALIVNCLSLAPPVPSPLEGE